MMFSNEYGEAAVEVLDILDNTNKSDVSKIPASFIKFLVDNASEEYIVNFDHSKRIDELNLMQKTKEILGVIYIKWWSEGKEKEGYLKQIEELEKREQEMIKQKYNPDKLFENNKKIKEYYKEPLEKTYDNESVSMVECKESIFKRIINKILNFFRR